MASGGWHRCEVARERKKTQAPIPRTERGVPLSVVVTATNGNDGPTLPELVNNAAVMRPQPSRAKPQPLCLGAAFDNTSTLGVVVIEHDPGHLALRTGRAHSLPLPPGGKARRWVVERTQAGPARLRRFGMNGEKPLESRAAFLCFTNALMA